MPVLIENPVNNLNTRIAMANVCFLTGATEKLIDVTVDGTVYWVTEEIADSCSMKQLNEKIRAKVAEGKNKKASLLASIEEMAKTHGCSREELIAVLGGKMQTDEVIEPEVESEPETPKMQQQVIPRSPLGATKKDKPKSQDDGFREVDGGLISPIRAGVRIENSSDSGHQIAGSMPAHSTSIKEEGKKVKTIKGDKNTGDTMIIKSNMGTTAIKVNSKDAYHLNKTISEVDRSTQYLVRKNITGGVGNAGNECPMCRGTGFTLINNSTCPKCDGVGVIYLGD